MKRLIVSLAASACFAALLGTAAPAHAAFVTFVSGDGDDGLACTSPETACRQIGGATGALSKTDPGGVVHVLPGEYNAFEIPANLSVGIIAEGGLASVLNGSVPIPGGGEASILINNVNSGAVVRIRGLQIESFGAPIAVVGNETTLHIERCVLAPLPGFNGIDFRPGGGLLTRLFVSDTVISKQVGLRTATGIRIRPTGSAGVSAVLDNVRIEDLGVGILIDGGGGTGAINMSIRDSVISGSGAQGLGVFEATTGGPSAVVLERTTVSGNGAQGIFASRALASVRVRQSAIAGNAVGVATANGGQIISHGDNVLAGNTTNGAFTSTVAPQ